MLIFFTFSFNLVCNELYTFASNSDRSDNPYFINILKNASLEECIQLLKGISIRNDYYIADILFYLTTFNKGSFIHEYLLRIALQYSFNTSLYNNSQVLMRIEANRTAIDYLFQNLNNFGDFQLKSTLIELFTYYRPQEFESILFNESQSIINYLIKYKKIDNPDIKVELISIIKIIILSNNPAFMEQLLKIIQLSSDKIIIEYARKALEITIKNNTHSGKM